MRTRLVFAAIVVGGCFEPRDSNISENQDDTFMPEPLPPDCKDSDAVDDESGDGCDDTDVMPGAAGASCIGTGECDEGLACMADFNGNIGGFECTAACIPDDDEEHWCIDDASCCNAESGCSLRGYCIVGLGSSGSSTGADSSTGASSTDGTGAGSTAGDESTGGASSSTGG